MFDFIAEVAKDYNDFVITTDYGAGTYDQLTLDETGGVTINLDLSDPIGTPPTHIAHQVTQTSGVNSVVVNTPAGGSAGDLMLAVFANTTRDQVTPSGWTLLGSIQSHTVQTGFDSAIYYKVHAGGSEPASHTFAVNTSTTNIGAMIVLCTGNADPGTTLPTKTSSNTQNSNPVVLDAVTPTHDFSLVYRFVTGRLGRSASSTPASHTMIYDNAGVTAPSVWCLTVEGDTGGVATANVTPSGTTEFHTFSVAVPPA